MKQNQFIFRNNRIKRITKLKIRFKYKNVNGFYWKQNISDMACMSSRHKLKTTLK